MVKRVLITVILVLLAAGMAWGTENRFEMPADMQKLMPADPVFIMAVTSVNDLDRQWRAIEEMMDDGHSAERVDIVGMLSKELPQFAEYADLDRPLAVAMGLPALMGGQKPPITFIVPLSESFNDQVKEEMEAEEMLHFFEGDYVAFSMDPAFTPSGRAPELAAALKAGFVTATLDLDAVLQSYRPLADMGLDSMGNSPAVADTAGGAEDAAPPAVNAEEIRAMQDMARAIMDSARRLDMALQIEDDALTLVTGFSVHQGSPLDPGPQPEFEQALQLTRLLPAGGHILQAMALDQTRQFEIFRPFYIATTEKEIAKMEAEQGEAYRAWVQSYLDSVDLFANPLAASIRMDGEMVVANMVMECPDAAAALDRFAELFDGLTAADIGLGLKKMPTGKVAGVEVRSWTVTYDAEKLAGYSQEPRSPHLSGAGSMQAEQMIAVLRKVTPNVNMAARGDYLVFSADPNTSNLSHMIQLAGQRRGAAIPEVAAAAAAAGPFCQQVVTGDLMSILTWVTEWMEELEDEEYAAVKGNPIPFTIAYTIEDADYGADWTMDMPAVQRLVKAVQDIEAQHDDQDDDQGDEEEVETEISD